MKKEDYIVKKRLFARYLYIDENTRIRYGFKLKYLGKSYTLERKTKRWITKAWTYNLSNDDLENLLGYLLWYENRHNKKSKEILF